MKRRLTIARSLVNEPELLLLDEPTTGLDPQARHVLWDRLFRLKQQGVTLVLTTHYMDEAEQLCDRLVVMDKGRIVAEGSPAELIGQRSTREVVELRFQPDEHEAMAGKLEDSAERVEVLPDRLLLYTDDGDAADAPCTSAACTRPACWSAAPRWRTSSSGSPAGRWWTDGTPHRDSRRRTLPRRGYAPVPVQADLARHRRQQRAARRVLFLAAMALGLGTLVDSSTSGGCRGPQLPGFLAPGLLAATAMQTGVGERRWPVMGASSGQRPTTPCSPPRSALDVLIGHLLLSSAPGSARLDRVPRRDGRLRRGGQPAGGADPAGRAARPGWRSPRRWWRSRRRRDRLRRSRSSAAFVVMPLFLFSGVFYPVTQLPLGWSSSAYLTPLWHGVALCRVGLALGTITAARGRCCMSRYLCAGSRSGVVLAARNYRRRLAVRWHGRRAP